MARASLRCSVGRIIALTARRDPHPRREAGTHQDCVAYVPQREEVDWRFPVTVSDVVMMGRFAQMGWLKRATAHDRAAVQKSLTQMGIADLAEQSIGQLSGGQQQRAFLARAIAQEPHILLMDEPFTGVDVTTQEATLRLLDHLQEQQVTAIVSTHDLNLAASRFDLVLLLNYRLIAFGNSPRSLYQGKPCASLRKFIIGHGWRHDACR